MARSLILFILFLLSVKSHAFDLESFRNGMSEKEEIYNDYASLPETKTLFTEGKVSESIKRLMTLIPDSKKTIFDYFLLGNMLFQNDNEASYKFMIEAEKKEPDNPYIIFERAIHEHRLGNYSLALAYSAENEHPFWSNVNT